MPTYEPHIGKKMRARMRRRRTHLLKLGIKPENVRTAGPFGVEVHARWDTWDGIVIEWHGANARPYVKGYADVLLSRPGDLRLLLSGSFKDYKRQDGEG